MRLKNSGRETNTGGHGGGEDGEGSHGADLAGGGRRAAGEPAEVAGRVA
jgi:hypothetical protein